MNGKIYVYFNKKKYEQEGIKKYYVGQTSRTISARSGSNGSGYHKYDNNIKSKFANAIRKWGWDSFELTVIEEGIKDQNKLNEKEMYYISFYDSFNKDITLQKVEMVLQGVNIQKCMVKFLQKNIEKN